MVEVDGAVDGVAVDGVAVDGVSRSDLLTAEATAEYESKCFLNASDSDVLRHLPALSPLSSTQDEFFSSLLKKVTRPVWLICTQATD